MDASRDLPLMMNKQNTACFTGHRHLPTERIDEIIKKIDHVIAILHRAGYRYFVCGGALGFDMLAEQRILHAAEQGLDVKLVLALPCRDQTLNWNGVDGVDMIREYQRIKGLASAIYYIENFYTSDCMKRRNASMVEISSFCTAYYNGNFRSGAGQTFRMAEKAGLKIYNIFDVVGKSE